jgi:hypothetical protein
MAGLAGNRAGFSGEGWIIKMHEANFFESACGFAGGFVDFGRGFGLAG